MYPELLKNVMIRAVLRFVQLDVAIPEPLQTEPPISVPGTPGTAASLPRILLPILAAVVVIVLLCLLYRRHRKKGTEAETAEAEGKAENSGSAPPSGN